MKNCKGNGNGIKREMEIRKKKEAGKQENGKQENRKLANGKQENWKMENKKIENVNRKWKWKMEIENGK